MDEDRHGKFFAAKDSLRAALQATTDETVSISRKQAEHLMFGHGPDKDLPKTHADFDATFMPFLEAINDSTMSPWEDISSLHLHGITVLPCAAGGVILGVTDGRIMLVAHDPSGHVTNEGVRLQIPYGAFEACRPAKPRCYHDQGDIYVAPPQPWEVADRVFAHNVCLLIIPKEQPPEIADDPDRTKDHVMLFSSGIETSNHIRHTDYRHEAPVPLWHALNGAQAPDDSMGEPKAATFSPRYVGVVARAMAALAMPWSWQLTSNDHCHLWQPIVPYHAEEGEEPAPLPPKVAIILSHLLAPKLSDWPAWFKNPPASPTTKVPAPEEAEGTLA